jgi:uncharacterized protein YabN with tetrapyrrole methylase and pyrophosphatase domain
VLYLVTEPAPIGWLHALNPSAQSLAALYRPGRRYRDVYEETVRTILDPVRRGLNVCALSYGHPGVLDQASREAIRLARSEGHRARILPGVSSVDCLFLDLELDPGDDGCQMFDATDFLVRRRAPDVTVPLVLWQISVIGRTDVTAEMNHAGLRVLAERLAEIYGADHEVVVYEATPFPIGTPTVERCRVSGLTDAGVTGMSSLYVPAAMRASEDSAMVARLGM